MFNIRKKASHFVRKARYDFMTRFFGEATAKTYSSSRVKNKHIKKQVPVSRKKAPSTNFWTGKRQTHSHKAYRHRMASVRRSNRSHAPGGAFSKGSRSWF